MSNIETSAIVDIGVQTQLHAGILIVTLAPSALEPAARGRVEHHARELVRSAAAGVVIDCHMLPKGAFEQAGPLLYELLILGRRQLPRVEVCAVGRVDQSIGESKVFVAPARFDTLEAALSFLARGRHAKLSFRRSSSVSESPLDFERKRTPSLIVRAMRVTGVVAVLGLTACLVTYSAIQSFGKSQTQRTLVLRELARSQAGTRLAIYGSIGFVSEGVSQRDSGAAIVIWPTRATPHKFALRAEEVFANRHLIKSDRIAYTTTDEVGAYVLTRRLFSDSGQGNYCMLVLSAHRERSTPHREKVLSQLARYFASPEELLGKHDYTFEQLSIDPFNPLERNVLFGENELRSAPMTVSQEAVPATPSPIP